MSTNKKELKFYDTNILGVDFNEWTLNNAIIQGSNIVISTGGYAEYNITDEKIIKACKNAKVIVTASGDITDDNNYKSGPDIRLVETYKLGEESTKRRTRYLTITPLTSEVNNNVYTNTTVIEMLGYDMSKLSVRIKNNTTSDLTIYNIEIYRSKDIDTSQLYEAQQELGNIYGLIIPVYYEDPANAVVGQVWLRGDL